MRGIVVIFFKPLKQGGCLGFFIFLLYVVILGGALLNILGGTLQGNSGYTPTPTTPIHEPRYPEPQQTNSIQSVVLNLDAQGYNIHQIRKFLKENGYREYSRKDIKQFLGR